MQKLKVDDEIIVITGKDKGKTGKVARIFWNKKKVVISGVNLVKKSLKPTQENPNGGFSEVELPLHISNVALISPKTKKATRVRIENKKGKKVRVAVACGSELK